MGRRLQAPWRTPRDALLTRKCGSNTCISGSGPAQAVEGMDGRLNGRPSNGRAHDGVDDLLRILEWLRLERLHGSVRGMIEPLPTWTCPGIPVYVV